jgi:hypothetical protein
MTYRSAGSSSITAMASGGRGFAVSMGMTFSCWMSHTTHSEVYHRRGSTCRVMISAGKVFYRLKIDTLWLESIYPQKGMRGSGSFGYCCLNLLYLL